MGFDLRPWPRPAGLCGPLRASAGFCLRGLCGLRASAGLRHLRPQRAQPASATSAGLRALCVPCSICHLSALCRLLQSCAASAAFAGLCCPCVLCSICGLSALWGSSAGPCAACAASVGLCDLCVFRNIRDLALCGPLRHLHASMGRGVLCSICGFSALCGSLRLLRPLRPSACLCGHCGLLHASACWRPVTAAAGRGFWGRSVVRVKCQ